MIKKYFIFISLVFLSGCAAVDLRGNTPREGFSQAEQDQGKKILIQAARSTGTLENWSKFSQFKVQATDHWSSTVLRWLTPVQTSDQKLQFIFDLSTENSLMTYIDGKTPGVAIGIKDGKTYKIIKNRLVKKHFGDVQMYLSHVRHYFLFPQILKDYPVTAYMGEGQADGSIYDKVFVSVSSASANSKVDQYVVWVNQKTGRIDFIEFTIRDFLPSLRGVIVYKDYRMVNGMWLPFEIILPPSMGSQEFVHRFSVDSIDLK